MSRAQWGFRSRRGRLALLATAGILLSALPLLAGKASGTQPFSPQLDVRLWNPNPAAASSVITEAWVNAGDYTFGTWSLALPSGWGVTNGSIVPVGDIVAEATMSVDLDCNGSIDEFGPLSLANQPIDPAGVADWTGLITPWWGLTVAVDGGGPNGYDLSADLTTITEPHTFCAPEVFAVTLFGRSVPGNVQLLTNPGQGSYTFTLFAVSRGGVYATQDPSSVNITTTTLPTTDVDGDGVIDELPCSSDPSNASVRPERTDGIFAGVDDNANGLTDEMPPPGASGYDCDGDGYKGSAEAAIYSPSAQKDQDPCGTDAWPSDFVSGGIFMSTDRVNIADLNSFLVPRRLETNPGDTNFDARWDLSPGTGIFSTWINIADLNTLLGGSSGFPPMLGGTRAFDGPICPWAPQPTPTPSPAPTPTASPSPTASPPPNGDTDGDGVIDETPCGSDPLNPASRPERLDGAFAGRDDDGDTLVDEALPAGAISYDCDGDGYKGSAEAAIFSPSTQKDQDPCGTDAWPSDFISGGIFNSTNKVNIADLNSFLSPRRLDTNPGDANFDARWDLSPGTGIFSTWINISDVNALVGGSSGFPPMLGGTRGFDGRDCPWPP